MEHLKYAKYLNKHVSDLSGQTFVITGANSGIGFYTSLLLISKNANIVMACRSKVRAEEARLKLLEVNPFGVVDILIYDQASFLSIDQFADELQSKYPKINGFVFNAGIFHPKKDAATTDGFPLTIGTNYLGAFYLFEKLNPYFERNINMHVVSVGSLANIMFHTGKFYKYFTCFKINIFRQYALSKMFLMANFTNFTLKENCSVQYSLMHPGVASTNIVSGPSNSYPDWFARLAKKFMLTFMNHPEKSALGVVLLLTKENAHGNYSRPRGLLGVSGYPKITKPPRYLTKRRTEVRDNTLSFFQSLNNSK